MELNIVIPTRDRLILTEKLINSIYDNTNSFNHIRISCFDNLSTLTPERSLFFTNLLNEGKIHYYSYDTSYSTSNCFPKAIEFQRWIDMMWLNKSFDSQFIKRSEFKDKYYLLIDNDMILGPDWDSYFISACNNNISKDLYFLTQYPGGITGRGRDRDKGKTTEYDIKNNFNNRPFKFITASRGGSSGFWFMNWEMLSRLTWDWEDYKKVYERFKRQDSVTWEMIKNKEGKDFHYVGALVPNQSPYVIHLGDFMGSICKQEMIKKYNEATLRRFEIKEEALKDLSHSEIFEKYKDKGSYW